MDKLIISFAYNRCHLTLADMSEVFMSDNSSGFSSQPLDTQWWIDRTGPRKNWTNNRDVQNKKIPTLNKNIQKNYLWKKFKNTILVIKAQVQAFRHSTVYNISQFWLWYASAVIGSFCRDSWYKSLYYFLFCIKPSSERRST